MKGILKGKFLGVNVNEFEGKKYYKGLFLCVNDDNKLYVEFVKISEENLSYLSQLVFGQDVELSVNWTVYNGKGSWRY